MDDPRPSRRIHAVVRSRIGDGTYPAGSHLNIGLLADEFDVTRTTVSKALRLLEADGLVELYTGVGWYVKNS